VSVPPKLLAVLEGAAKVDDEAFAASAERALLAIVKIDGEARCLAWTSPPPRPWDGRPLRWVHRSLSRRSTEHSPEALRSFAWALSPQGEFNLATAAGPMRFRTLRWLARPGRDAREMLDRAFGELALEQL
jgi:hypothetical protein